jgi:hypothetical protein
MAEPVESETDHSLGSPAVSGQLSPVSQAIDALDLDPTLSLYKAAKMFRDAGRP